MFVLGRCLHRGPCGREASLAHLFEGDADRQAERGDAVTDRLAGNAGIHEGTERHVAADAAKTVEMGYLHAAMLLYLDFIDGARNWLAATQAAG